MFAFQLVGRIKPYVRMTQKSKFADPQAQEYLASKNALQWQMKQQMARNGWGMIQRGIKLGAILTIRPARHNADLDNIVKAVLDAAQGIVYEDDRWIDHICSGRTEGDDDVTYLTVFKLEESHANGTP